MSDPCHDRGSSFREVLESLINETVRVDPTGTTTSIHGKLITVHSSYVAIAVNESCEDSHSVRLAWIPVNRISVISER